LDNKLLTKKDLAERWQVDERTVDRYREEKIITPVKNLPCIRFNLQHILAVEETQFDKFSPMERRRLEKELEYWKQRAERAENALVKANIDIMEAIHFKMVSDK
jgi:hypothetical protein